ncbi:DUF6571 family protein [Streptomyces sp. NPDC088116]|uniref:DUF6571 family protein n=1 Tax=Streptomyces sp. NPDC088116 TaxID=3365825 RepID=UPI00380CFE93
MVTCQELQDLNLSKLNTAVEQWKQMLDKLVLLADGGDGEVNAADLERKANAADWKGDNAAVTKEFTTTTARQFDDMVTEARSIHKIIQEAHRDLKKHKDDLRTTIDAWAKKNVYIDEKGGARYGGPPREVEGGPKEQTSQEEVDRAAREVARILEAANETDRIAARALRKHAESKYDFDETGFTGLKDADRKQGIEDADAMVKLASKGDGMSDDELKKFNEISRYHRDNPAFAERFATKLGPEGTLEFWRSLADPGKGNTPDPDGDRAKILAKVQDNLGVTLANATHSDSPEMRAWKDRMVELGDDPIKAKNGIPSAPYGFQVLGPLMTEGKWDSAFLNKYGDKMLEFERKSDDPVLGGPKELWENRFNPAQLSYPPGATKPDSDPVANLMEALGHNPEASVQFFDGSSGKGDDAMSNWDYLVNKGGEGAREWPTDDDGKTTGFTNLGHALEAGTLGYPYDAKDPAVPPMDTKEQIEAREARTALMDRVVDHYQTSDQIDKQDGIRDSLANMAAGHVDSLNYSAADFGGSGPKSGRDDLFDAQGNHLRDFDSGSTTSFLRALATDKDAYDTVSTAQQIYGASAMAGQGDDVDDAKRIGMHSVKMHGMLDEVRAEAIGKEFADDKDARNLELEKQAEWRKYAAGAAIGVAAGVGAAVVVPTGVAAAIAVPLAFETAGGAAETKFGIQTMDWLKANEYDNTDQSIKGIDQARQEGQHNAMTPLLNWATARGMSEDEIWDLSVTAEKEYGAGTERTDTDNARG